jgi:predicted membrane protein
VSLHLVGVGMIVDRPFLDFTPADSVVKLVSAMLISPVVALCLAMSMSVLVKCQQAVTSSAGI